MILIQRVNPLYKMGKYIVASDGTPACNTVKWFALGWKPKKKVKR